MPCVIPLHLFLQNESIRVNFDGERILTAEFGATGRIQARSGTAHSQLKGREAEGLDALRLRVTRHVRMVCKTGEVRRAP